MPTHPRGSRPLRVLMMPSPGRAATNPYLGLLAAGVTAERDVSVRGLTFARVVRGEGDVVHLHWPEFVVSSPSAGRATVRLARFLLTLLLARLRGMPVLWTLHNLRGHERLHPRLQAALWWALPRLVTGWFSLSEAGRVVAADAVPALAGRRSWVTRHGDYRPHYPRPADRAGARRRLGLAPDDLVLLSVGHVRAYKNVPGLVVCARASVERPVLIVAGECSPPSLTGELLTAAGGDGRIRLELAEVPDDRMLDLVAAADLVALAYATSFNSGAALLALTLGRPVLLPDSPTYRELRGDVGGQWVHLYAGDLTPEVLDEILTEVRAAPPAGNALDERFSWESVGAATVRAYREALGRPSS